MVPCRFSLELPLFSCICLHLVVNLGSIVSPSSLRDSNLSQFLNELLSSFFPSPLLLYIVGLVHRHLRSQIIMSQPQLSITFVPSSLGSHLYQAFIFSLPMEFFFFFFSFLFFFSLWRGK